jgi:hypothetical protein
VTRAATTQSMGFSLMDFVSMRTPLPKENKQNTLGRDPRFYY